MQVVRLIAKKDSAELSEREKFTLEKFHAFGCTNCHRIAEGAVRLTEHGMWMSQANRSCPKVMRALSQ